MKIFKLAFNTIIAFVVVIFLVGLINSGTTANSIYTVLCLIPLASGLYMVGAGISNSLKEKTFKTNIFYGCFLAIIGVFFWFYMGFTVLKFLHF